ncbi:hypothetical protein ACLX1H_006531 [Fusarium chlamydosporum]
MPGRLIHIGDPCYNTLCLKDTEGTQPVPYVALSYCWGDKGQNRFRTEKRTLALRRQGFDLAQLPTTLQDAVKTTRTLGLHYIWIDALCIVQDCEADKNREISKMWQIYRNATIEEDPDEFSTVDEVEAFYEWKRIVEDFTTRSITKAADRLPALAAIAADYAERHSITSGQYKAGLWTPWLEMGLLWYIKDLNDQATCPNDLAIEDRSPTWSWHLARSGISWHDNLSYQGVSDCFKLEIQWCETKLANDEIEYGRVENGSLKVLGALLKIFLQEAQPMCTKPDGTEASIPIQIWWDSQDIAHEKDLYCLQVRYVSKFIPEGIVLKQSNGAFYRVGYFQPDDQKRAP